MGISITHATTMFCGTDNIPRKSECGNTREYYRSHIAIGMDLNNVMAKEGHCFWFILDKKKTICSLSNKYNY